MVGDSQRGATVEAVITRMKMVQTLSASAALHPIRFVAVSATLPNTEDVSTLVLLKGVEVIIDMEWKDGKSLLGER